MKAFYFEGNMGMNIREEEIPAEFLEEAKKYRAELVEKIVEQDDALMSAYLDGKEPSFEDMKKTLRAATLKVKLIPVFAGSALKNKGVQLVLDGVVDYLPSPIDVPPVHGIDPKTNAEIILSSNIEIKYSNTSITILSFCISIIPFN
jgi:elongation factor G